VTSYAIDDSTMVQILPEAMSYLSAGFSAPDSSGWDDFNYTSPDNNFMTVTDQLGSIGQPTVGTVVVDGVTQFKQIYTWTTVTGGVTLNQAKWEIYDSSNDVLIKMLAVVDSLHVTLLTSRPQQMIQDVGDFLASVSPSRAELARMNPFAVERLWAEAYMFSACSEAKVDLFWGRVQLAAGAAGFALAPNPATFLAFAYTVGYVGTMRRRMLAACKA
jgi:hypothetical protein